MLGRFAFLVATVLLTVVWSGDPREVAASKSDPTETTANGAPRENTDGSAKDELNTGERALAPNHAATTIPPSSLHDLKEKDSADPDKDTSDVSDYWPWPVFGIHLKVTDSLLALFTFFLVLIGASQAHRLRQTVESVIRGEQPHIFDSDPKPSLFPRGAYAMYPESPDTPKPSADFFLVNYGRTPGFVTLIRSELLLGAELPQSRKFEFATRVEGEGVLKKESDSVSYTTEFHRNLTSEEIAALREEKLFFFLFGIIQYRDVFDVRHERGFGFRFDKRSPGFRRWGGKTYNYYKTKTR
jgi:hypothetical protein